MKEWTELIDKMGWPAAGLLLVGFVTWRLWVFSKPYLQKFFDAQLDLIESVKDSNQKMSDATNKMGDTLSALHDRHNRHDEALTRIEAKVTK